MTDLCVCCGDPVSQPLNIGGIKVTPKKHCRGCFMELTLGTVPKGCYVHHTDTRTGGGRRVLRSEKSLQ